MLSFRLLKSLGCPHGCSDKTVWASGEFLRDTWPPSQQQIKGLYLIAWCEIQWDNSVLWPLAGHHCSVLWRDCCDGGAAGPSVSPSSLACTGLTRKSLGASWRVWLITDQSLFSWHFSILISASAPTCQTLFPPGSSTQVRERKVKIVFIFFYLEKKSVSPRGGPDLSPMGYTNNFGETAGMGTKEGVQTEIISFTFKKFVTKIMDQMPSLSKPENTSVSQDMRHFLSFIHSSHGNTFRKVVVSGLLLSIPTVENYKIEGKCYSRSVNWSEKCTLHSY